MQRLSSGWRRQGRSVGLVPTMGYLHQGHLSLVKEARRAVGRRGKVVLSIYVNPTQFGPSEDFSRYPRDLLRDLRLCRNEGVDAVFTPSDRDMYPEGFSTYVAEEKLSSGMEGASRPTHFRGVTTIVAKLFHIVQPEVAVFGAKDYQQAAVIKRMVRDLNFPLRVILAPTVREADGLAMSSRNKYLEGNLRKSALVLSRTSKEIQRLVRSKPVAASALKQRVRSRVNKTAGARLDYVEFFDAETLEPLSTVKRGAHMALAVFLGRTRLIDNAAL
jgi:pantoate--beta-alanine ligase